MVSRLVSSPTHGNTNSTKEAELMTVLLRLIDCTAGTSYDPSDVTVSGLIGVVRYPRKWGNGVSL